MISDLAVIVFWRPQTNGVASELVGGTFFNKFT